MEILVVLVVLGVIALPAAVVVWLAVRPKKAGDRSRQWYAEKELVRRAEVARARRELSGDAGAQDSTPGV